MTWMAQTSRAETLLSDGTVQCVQSHLQAAARPLGLRSAVDALVMENGGLAHVRLQIGTADQQRPILMEGFRLPETRWSLGQRPHAIPITNPPRRDQAGAAEFLIALCHLTPAEANITLRLIEGKSRTDIAATCKVTLQTLNRQIKSLYAKCGFDSERNLMSTLSGLLP